MREEVSTDAASGYSWNRLVGRDKNGIHGRAKTMKFDTAQQKEGAQPRSRGGQETRDRS